MMQGPLLPDERALSKVVYDSGAHRVFGNDTGQCADRKLELCGMTVLGKGYEVFDETSD